MRRRDSSGAVSSSPQKASTQALRFPLTGPRATSRSMGTTRPRGGVQRAQRPGAVDGLPRRHVVPGPAAHDEGEQVGKVKLVKHGKSSRKSEEMERP